MTCRCVNVMDITSIGTFCHLVACLGCLDLTWTVIAVKRERSLLWRKYLMGSVNQYSGQLLRKSQEMKKSSIPFQETDKSLSNWFWSLWISWEHVTTRGVKKPSRRVRRLVCRAVFIAPYFIFFQIFLRFFNDGF